MKSPTATAALCKEGSTGIATARSAFAYPESRELTWKRGAQTKRKQECEGEDGARRSESRLTLKHHKESFCPIAGRTNAVFLSCEARKELASSEVFALLTC